MLEREQKKNLATSQNIFAFWDTSCIISKKDTGDNTCTYVTLLTATWVRTG